MKRLLVSAVVLALASCGGGEQTTTETETPQSSETATPPESQAPGVDQMAQGMQQLAQGFQQMAQGRASPVNFESLQAVLPAVEGWTQSGARGEQMSTPVAFARAEATYERNGVEVDLEVTDTALNQLLIAPVSMFMASGYEERSSEGYKRATTIAGSPGFEEWNQEAGRGEVTVFVANRFIVRGTGTGLDNLDPVEQIVEAVDTAELGALK